MGPEISLADWQGYVSLDAELSPVRRPVIGAMHPSCPVVWLADGAGRRTVMSHVQGNIHASDPSAEGIAKMWQIARKLGAVVQGSSGDYYDKSGLPLSVPARDRRAAAYVHMVDLNIPDRPRAWWRIW